MNAYSLVGLFMAASVLIVGLFLASQNISVFLDYNSLFIVFGGTIAATAISFQLNRILLLFKIFVERMLRGKKYEYKNVIQELMTSSENFRKGKGFSDLAKQAEDPFLKEGLQLLADEVIEHDEILILLNKRVKNMYEAHMDDAQKIGTVGKFPPAFGMMGTTIGMVVLLGNLTGPDAVDIIGPAMAVCLITTLYGVIISNLAIIPVSENLKGSAKEIFLKNKIIIRGIELLLEKQNPIIIAEELNSFLTPSDRLDWKSLTGK